MCSDTKIKNRMLLRILVLVPVALSASSSTKPAGQISPHVQSSTRPSAEIESFDLDSMAYSTQALVEEDERIYRQKEALRKQEASLQTALHTARNILLSILLLIGVIVAATLTVRDASAASVAASAKPGSQCPLQPCFGRDEKLSQKSEKADECLEDAPVDWDKILTSSKYTCVFDPSRLSLDNLLALPPPTFKSKDEFGKAMAYFNLLNQFSANRQYINIAE